MNNQTIIIVDILGSAPLSLQRKEGERTEPKSFRKKEIYYESEAVCQ